MNATLLYNRKTGRLSAAPMIAASFFLPFLIVVLGLLALHIAPFGDHNLAICDGQLYFCGFVHSGRLLRGEDNLLYSFYNGLGGNNWSQLAWGGLTPGMLFAYSTTAENVAALYSWVSVFNMSLCGLTMYLLLVGIHGCHVEDLIFSTAYALMGHNAVNCFQNLFFIGPQILPLVILGLVRLLRGKSPLLYILSLACVIFLNFYFGFMLCVASVVYFAAYYYAANRALMGRRARVFGVYAISSLLAGLLAAPMWLPAIKAYTGGGRIEQAMMSSFSFTENMPFIQMFAKLFTGAHSINELRDGYPIIFCGILVVALVLLYFISASVPVRRKRAAGGVLVIYLLSFYISAFTKLMHGGTHTNWFPYRYSFVFSFFLIALAMEAFQYIGELTRRDVKRCGLTLLLGTLMVFSVRYEFIGAGTVLLDLALLLVMGLGVWLYRKDPLKTTKRTLAVFLLLVTSLNLYANYTITVYKMREWETNLEQFRTNTVITGSSVDAIKEVDPTFFRMEKDISETTSGGADPYLYGYHGVSHSGPTEREYFHRSLNRLGINWYDMRHWYQHGVTAATDALFGLKYLLSPNDLTEEKGYPSLVGTEAMMLYYNPNALPVAMLAGKSCTDIVLGNDPYENLNEIYKRMTGGDRDVFTLQREGIRFTLHNKIEGRTTTSEALQMSMSEAEAGKSDANIDDLTTVDIEFTAKQDGPIYRFDTTVPASVQGSRNTANWYCGIHRAGDTVKDIISADVDFSPLKDFQNICAALSYAYVNDDVLKDYAALLKARDISFNVESQTDLTGTFDAESDQVILFTIPWDEGWTCYIDGQATPIEKTWDLFMSVSVPAGKHSYEMKFFPAWLNYGIDLCLAALAGLVILMVIYYLKRGAQRSSVECEQG